APGPSRNRERLHQARRATLRPPRVHRPRSDRAVRAGGHAADLRVQRIPRPSVGARGAGSMTVDVAVVGGGPAGALTALLLARRGREVIVVERAPAWRWRACGVFASPAAVTALREAGIEETDLERCARPITAMRVEAPRGASFRLTYGGTGSLADAPVGFDRARLDPLLLERAAAAGAVIRAGVGVVGIELAGQDRQRRPARLTLAD